ncbi:hypothetical protein HOL24_00340 [bacterium]|jgi:acyl carrier protein|nr:hypothetical protein [bacterium]
MTEKELFQLVSESLEVSVEKINLESSQDKIEEWDSLGHLSILSSLSKDLGDGIKNVKGLGNCESLSCIIKILKSAGLLE